MSAALARVGIELPAIRGFNFADMQTHGRWMMERMFKAFPHLTQREVETWLRSIQHAQGYLMLYQDNSVALAQVVPAQGLGATSVVQEIFVWCEKPDDKAQQKEAAAFYDNIAEWARNMKIDTVVVEENSDVPHEMIKEKLGRLYERKQWFARL